MKPMASPGASTSSPAISPPSSIRRKLSALSAVALAGQAADAADPVFHPVTNNRTGDLDRPLDPASVYQNIVRKYGLETGISAQVNGLCVHSLHATAATNALSHEADIAKVQEWLGHANVSTRGCTTDAKNAKVQIALVIN